MRRDIKKRRHDFVAQMSPREQAICFSMLPAPVLSLLQDLRDDRLTIGLYAQTGAEAPALKLAPKLLAEGYNIGLPVIGNDDNMAFMLWDGQSPLETGRYGIAQPVDTDHVFPDILITPLLAFDRTGHRLGQGGGYYDRYIAQNRPKLLVGLAWSVQEVQSIPSESHDQALNAVLTQTEWIECHAS